jgi:hypothetical protein
MRRLFALLVIAPPASAAGFYLASFGYRLVTHLSFFVASVGLIVLTLLGIISRNTPEEAYAPLLLVERARASEGAMYAAGWLGALLVLVLVVIVVVVAKGAEEASWRRARWAGAVVAVLAVFAGGADLYYGVTPYVERIMPHSSMAAAERSVTCRLTVVEIAQLPDKLSRCVAEVEGILVYPEGSTRFELQQEGVRHPTIQVSFFRGRRTLFTEASRTVPPRFYDQVSGFVGKRVRIVGTAVNGQVSADVGHVALAEARIQ